MKCWERKKKMRVHYLQELMTIFEQPEYVMCGLCKRLFNKKSFKEKGGDDEIQK